MIIISYTKYKTLLTEKGVNSYTVSKITGIHQSILSDWKTGRSFPKVEKLYILAKYFGVKIEDFIEEENTK